MTIPVASLRADLTLATASFEAGAERARNQLRRTRESVATDAAQMSAAVTRSADQMAAGIDAAGAAFGRMSRETQGQLQNVAFQLQDFVVQISSGTSAAQAFAQQAPQLFGAFGAGGAVLGLVAGVVGGLATKFLDLGDAAAASAAAADELARAQERTQAALDGAGFSASDLAARYRQMTADQREFAATELERAVDSQTKALANQRAALVGMLEPYNDLRGLIPEADAANRSFFEALDQFVEGGSAVALRDALQANVEVAPDLAAEVLPVIDGFVAMTKSAATAAEELAALQRAQEQLAASMAPTITGAPPGGMGRGSGADAAQFAAALQRQTEAYNADLAARVRAEEQAARDQQRLAEQAAREAERLREQQRREEERSYERQFAAIQREADQVIAEEERAQAERVRIQQRAHDEARRMAERESQRQADLMAEPFLEAARSMQRAFSDAFQRIIRDGEVSFEDLGYSIRDITSRAISDALSARLTSSIQTSIQGMSAGGTAGMSAFPSLGSIFTTSGSMFSRGGMFGPSAAYGTAGSTSLPMMPGMSAGVGAPAGAGMGSTFMSALGPAAIGYTLGSTLGPMVGFRGQNAGVGAGIGAGLGFAIGGPIGAIAGGLLGGTVGGIFGPDKSDRTQITGFDFRTGQTYQDGLTGEKFSAQNRQIADQLAQQLAVYGQQLAQKYGETLTTSFEIRAGDRDGLRFKFGGDEFQNFTSAADLLSSAMKRIESNFGTAAERAAKLAEAERELALARSDEVVRDYRQRLNQNPFAQLIRDYNAITAEIRAAGARGLRGADLQPLRDVRADTVNAYVEDFLGRYGSGPQAGLAGVIRQITTEFDLAIRSLERIGQSTAGFPEARAKAISDAIDQFVGSFETNAGPIDQLRERIRQIDEAIRQVTDVGGNAAGLRDARGGTLTAFVDQLVAANQNLTPVEQLRRTVSELLDAARAVDELGGSAGRLRDAARDVVEDFAQGLADQYRTLTPAEQLRETVAELRAAAQAVVELGGSAGALNDAVRDVVEAFAEQTVAQFRQLSQLDQVRQALGQIDDAIAAVVELGGATAELREVRRDYLKGQVTAIGGGYIAQDPVAQFLADARDVRALGQMGASNANWTLRQMADGFVGQLVEAFEEPDAQARLWQTVNQIDAAIAAMRELGLSEDRLVAARQRAIEAAREAAEAEVEAAEDRVRSAGEQMRAFVQSLADPLRDSLRAIQVGPLSVLGGRAQVNMLRGGVDDLLRAAGNDNIEALQSVGGAAQDYLQALRSYGASGALYQAEYNRLVPAIQQLLSRQEARERSLPDILERTAAQQLDVLQRQLKEAQDQHRDVLRELRQLNASFSTSRRAA